MNCRRKLGSNFCLAGVHSTTNLLFLLIMVLFCLFPHHSLAADDFSWCSGRFTFETNRWGYDNGIWTVYGWFYHRDDTHVYALRVDGSTTYSTSNDYSTCPVFTDVTTYADDLMDYAIIRYDSPRGVVTQTFEGVTGPCCGLDITVSIENSDTVPHFYEWRVYHDTGFGENESICLPPPPATPTVKDVVTDGGKVCLGNLKTCFNNERYMENIPCDIGFMFWNPDENEPAFLMQFTGQNLPYNVEVVDWSKGLFPCVTWNHLVAGNPIGGCDDDNSLLMIWRIPERGSLLPGQKEAITYMMSDGCLRRCTHPTPAISPPPEFTPTPTNTPTTAVPTQYTISLLIVLLLISASLGLIPLYSLSKNTLHK